MTGPTDRIVLYANSIDELTDQHDLNIPEPANGEDWGLIAINHTDSSVTIEFIYSEATITLPLHDYADLLEETTTTVYSYSNPISTILQVGMDTVLDARHGEPVHEWLNPMLPELIGAVFAAQADQEERKWPT